jgi:hypothetical protein
MENTNSILPSQPFMPQQFRAIDRQSLPVMEPYLLHSKERSCEFSLANLYVWSFSYQGEWQIWNNRLYLRYSDQDELFFTSDSRSGNDPSVEELYAVSNAMKHAGFSGAFTQVRREYLDEHADIEKYFTVESISDDSAEYLYSVQDLYELKGRKLSKKRNLIAQFNQQYPQCQVFTISHEHIQDCIRLSKTWCSMQNDPQNPLILHEAIALEHLADCFDDLHMEGVIAYIEKQPIAYALANRISLDIWTEPFEKAMPGYKGASQFINHKLAELLYPRAIILNREQDLGDEGLRKAKLSYAPVELLKNFRLIPK